jgi:hypothetical protein
MKATAFGLAAILVAGISGACGAQDLKAAHRLSDTQLGFDPSGDYGNYTLTVTGPNGFHASASSRTGTPTIDLRRFGAFDDGAYYYQLNASSSEKAVDRSGLDNGREGRATGAMLQGVSTSGLFHVKGGTIVKFDPNAREDVKRQK